MEPIETSTIWLPTERMETFGKHKGGDAAAINYLLLLLHTLLLPSHRRSLFRQTNASVLVSRAFGKLQQIGGNINYIPALEALAPGNYYT